MTIKFNPIVILGLFIGVALLIFAMIRGCNNSKSALADNKDLKDKVAWLQKDTTDAAYNAKEYQTRLDLQEGEITLWQNIAFSKNDSLAAANGRINDLIARHKPQKPNSDTTITTVPNEYIQDCEGCFSELSGDRDLVRRYKTANDSLQSALENMIRLDSNRISQLNKNNSDLTFTLRGALDGWRRTDSLLKPHWKLLFSLSTLWLPKINSTTGGTIWPNGAGVGFGYQDKNNRIVAGKWFTTEVGPVKQIDVFVPLSFRRRKY